MTKSFVAGHTLQDSVIAKNYLGLLSVLFRRVSQQCRKSSHISISDLLSIRLSKFLTPIYMKLHWLMFHRHLFFLSALTSFISLTFFVSSEIITKRRTCSLVSIKFKWRKFLAWIHLRVDYYMNGWLHLISGYRWMITLEITDVHATSWYVKHVIYRYSAARDTPFI